MPRKEAILRTRDVVGILVVLLVTVTAAVGYVWWQMEGEVSRQGWIALGIGSALTLLLLAVLLRLMRHSHEKGYDDDAGHL
jgi:hypothetical protein